jgi:gamma-glutamylcyclotransferase (GGCT)/AIG2-like uncharacterized protein YtfP
MTSADLPIFVYGTLRPGQANHGWALRGRTVTAEPAVLPGAVLYAGPGYPYAVRAPEGGGAAVHGDLIHPAPEQHAAVLADLDRLEGTEYERVAAAVRRRDGTTVRAWVYLATAPLAARLRTTGTPIAGGDWLRRREER